MDPQETPSELVPKELEGFSMEPPPVGVQDKEGKCHPCPAGSGGRQWRLLRGSVGQSRHPQGQISPVARVGGTWSSISTLRPARKQQSQSHPRENRSVQPPNRCGDDALPPFPGKTGCGFGGERACARFVLLGVPGRILIDVGIPERIILGYCISLWLQSQGQQFSLIFCLIFFFLGMFAVNIVQSLGFEAFVHAGEHHPQECVEENLVAKASSSSSIASRVE